MASAQNGSDAGQSHIQSTGCGGRARQRAFSLIESGGDAGFNRVETLPHQWLLFFTHLAQKRLQVFPACPAGRPDKELAPFPSSRSSLADEIAAKASFSERVELREQFHVRRADVKPLATPDVRTEEVDLRARLQTQPILPPARSSRAHRTRAGCESPAR